MKENIFKIETIKNREEGEVSFCAERGGIITSLKLKNKEILFFDEETFIHPYMGVRAGIQILFPNAGSIIENPLYVGLKRHGFARNQEWQSKKNEDGFKEELSSNDETRKVYPFNFRFSVTGKFEKNSSFSLYQEVENKENDVGVPISMGLHPYFKVSDSEKINIKFDFCGGEKVQNKVEDWSDDKYVSIDNPKIEDPGAVLKISIPGLGILIIDVSIEYEKIWIWSMSGRDFICIEPIMRDINGLIKNPQIINSKEIFKTNINIKLE